MRVLVTAVTAFALSAVLAAAQLDEPGVKAAFVRNFTTFVTWPAAVLAPSETMTVCVMNDRVMTARLGALVTSTSRLRVKAISGLPELEGCHVVFVPTAEMAHARDIAAQNGGRGLLTIGEADERGRTGAVISLFVANNRVGFDIDLKAAETSGVQVSSKLLSLARQVHVDSSAGRPDTKPMERARP